MNLKALLLALSTALLPACASMEAGDIFGGERYTYSEGFYDGHYGPLYSGFWGPDHYFYYSTAAGQPHFRDSARHFREHAAEGFRPTRVPDRMHVAHPHPQ